MALSHYLLVYSLRESKLVHLEPFDHDVERATDAYAALEQEYRERDDHADFEIVLIGADSLDTVRRTHSRYFTDDLLVPFAV